MEIGKITTATMRVSKYFPDAGYGFTANKSNMEVFFHRDSFIRGSSAGLSPPPIVGEEVEVSYPYENGRDSRNAPRATEVVRKGSPQIQQGTVAEFDEDKGYGFIDADHGASYYLHQSEMEGRSVPIIGNKVSFYLGQRGGKFRACHVCYTSPLNRKADGPRRQE